MQVLLFNPFLWAQEVRYTYTGTSTTPSNTVTTNYTYDTAGNIRSVSEQTNNDAAVTTNYVYGNSDWADLLTSYDGHTISYNGGNPTNWYNGETYSNLTWEQGRRLSSVTKGTGSDVTSISYTYDMSGIRSSKTVSGVTHNYVTQSGRVVRESYDNKVLDFFYDANGRPFALDYSTNNGTNFTKYYYVLNAQGDVVGLMDRDGNLIVKYAYDAWGKLLSVTDASSSNIPDTTHIANINPLRYRGYYWDSDTGWYYLQSRYYDPIVKRFLNADSQTDHKAGVAGLNLFAYCANSPANYKDDSGNSVIACIIVGAIIGAVAGGFIGDAQANAAGYTSADGWNYWQYVVVDGIAGALVGAAAGYCVGSVAAGAVVTTGATSSAALSAYANWAEYAATHPASGSYYIGRLFENWFYEFFGVAKQYQQVCHANSRFDAIYNGYIYELKNYDWSKYTYLGGLIKKFCNQASKYLSCVHSIICGEKINGVVFYFSSRPPQEVYDALTELGIIVQWAE